MEKITKSQVKARMKKLEAGEKLSLWLCPSNCYPNIGHPFNCAINVELEKDGEWLQDTEEHRSLDSLINSFSYYNCNAELGNRVHYYID